MVIVTIFLQNKPKYLETSWGYLKKVTMYVKTYCRCFGGNYLIELGYFRFYHLVTLHNTFCSLSNTYLAI